eukprot:COSAG01_NODE_131_length_24907_cov_19.802201_13_plen_44_part_00
MALLEGVVGKRQVGWLLLLLLPAVPVLPRDTHHYLGVLLVLWV